MLYSSAGGRQAGVRIWRTVGGGGGQISLSPLRPGCAISQGPGRTPGAQRHSTQVSQAPR